MSKIADIVAEFAKPIVEAKGCLLWDVEYVKEAGQWYLRVYIDKPEGVSIDDCEAVSRAIDPVLDEKDPIAESYTFEVSSAGLDRQLKKPEHFAQFMGEEVEVRLYKPIDGAKQHVGTLLSYENGDVTIAAANENKRFSKDQVAAVRLSLI